MQRISSKTIYIIINVSILFMIMLSAPLFVDTNVSLNPIQTWAENTSGLRAIGISFSILALLSPMVMKKKLFGIINNPETKPWKAINTLIAFRFAFLLGPIIYGKILVYLGMGVQEFLGYFAASILGVLVCGAITLRGK